MTLDELLGDPEPASEVGCPAYVAGGSGSDVVLVHGLGGSHLNWMRVAPLLANRRVIVPDLPGFGLTPRRRRITLACCRDAVLRVIDEVALGPVPLEVIDAHVAFEQHHRDRTWLARSLCEATRSLFGAMTLRRRWFRLEQRVTAPTLLIHGAEDRLIPLATAEAAAARHPGWELVVLREVGHAAPLEAPDPVAEAVLGGAASSRDNRSRVSAPPTRRTSVLSPCPVVRRR